MHKNKLQHIAFILDGNKRWAKKNKISLKKGYSDGLNNIHHLIESCLKIKLPYLTLFTLSSENIKRTSVDKIFEVIYDEFSFFFEKLIKEKNVKIKIIGSRSNIPKKILKLIDHCENETKDNLGLELNLAFNYGFKNEIIDVINKVIDNKEYNITSEKDLRKLFYLGNIPDPDILVRTGGYKRLSNFIMYNLTYTEIYFVDTLWPQFSSKELMKIITNYKSIIRTYGL